MSAYSNTTRAQDVQIDDARNSAISAVEMLAEEWNKTVGELNEALDTITDLERRIAELESEGDER